jgi:LDH2 family malate/lactate/ureidoglycolate dehydrogenase
MGNVTVSGPEARAFVTSVFVALGAPRDIAAEVSRHLVEANLVGHDSHGIIRIPEYATQIREGSLHPAARPKVLAESGALAQCSGEWGFGQVAGRFATEQAVNRALGHGVGGASLIRCNHVGRLGDFMEGAASRGCAALMFMGGFGLTYGVVPYGGAEAVFGSNPVAAGFPTSSGTFLLDYATSEIASGRILVAREAGERIPEGWMVDREGRPTTDPEDLLRGGHTLPFGKYKGTALAVLAELLGSVLIGSRDVAEEGGGGPTYAGSGVTVLAIDLGLVRDAAMVRDAAGAFLDRLRTVRPAPGFARVLAPGDPEAESRERRKESGFQLAEATWRHVLAVAREAGIAESEIPQLKP